MQLRTVDKWVHQVPTLAPGLHAGRLPLGAVGEHGGMVLAGGDTLGGDPRRSRMGSIAREGGEGNIQGRRRRTGNEKGKREAVRGKHQTQGGV